MIKITLNEIVGNAENLKELQTIKLPVKISYRIMRLVNKLDPILKVYDEKRNELVKEFGEPVDEQGNKKVTDPAKLKLFAEKLGELLKTEENIDFDLLKIEDLGDVKIEPKLLIPFLFE
jgi:hypothetical protein